MWYTADGMGWWMLWGGLMMVIFWGAIIALIVWAFQASTQLGGDRGASSNAGSEQLKPLDIARKRYAEGEITRVEFDQLREDLEDYSRSEVVQVSGKRTRRTKRREVAQHGKDNDYLRPHETPLGSLF